MGKFQEDQRIKKYKKIQKSVNGSQGLQYPFLRYQKLRKIRKSMNGSQGLPLPKTNIFPEKWPSQKGKDRLPTIHVHWQCWLGSVINPYLWNSGKIPTKKKVYQKSYSNGSPRENKTAWQLINPELALSLESELFHQSCMQSRKKWLFVRPCSGTSRRVS